MTDQLGLAEGRPFTVADLETMPDDGRRYELIDGTLLVSPAPTWSHQEMAGAIYRQLHASCPPHLRVLIAPFAVRTSTLDEVHPDVIVAQFAELTEKFLPVGPALAVEVLSRSTRLHDRNTKLDHYARLGVVSYWLLNPVEPGTIEVRELDETGAYQLVASAAGEESVTVQRPFPLTICPARLLDGRRPT
ncbi:MAG: Uma2 family endonuclease [Sporichthyaceae bacterium]